MKSNLYTDELEEDEDVNLKIVRKKSRKTNDTLENQSFIEFILMDFKNYEELNKFKNMRSLSLINQYVTSIEVN